MPIKAIVYCRVSSTKQMQKGDSPKAQEKASLRKAEGSGYKRSEIKVFPYESYTGKKTSRPVLDSIFKYVEKNKSVEKMFFKCIDRLSRGGAGEYADIKKRLNNLGVDLVDTEEIIQPKENMLKGSGETC